MSHPLGFFYSSLLSSRSIFFPSLIVLISLFPSTTSLHCHQHSSIEKSKSPLMNTCMTSRYGYCITKEMNGRVERNCDGNGVQQISVCKELMDPDSKTALVYPRETVYDHRGFTSDRSGRRVGNGCVSSSGYGCGIGSDVHLKSVSPNGPPSKNDERDQYTSIKQARVRAPSDSSPISFSPTVRPSSNCFDMGQLGRICCCKTEKCNSSSSLSLFLLLLISILPRL